MLLLHFVLEEKLVANKLLYNNLYSCVVVRRVSKGGAFGARAPPLSLIPNEKIYGD